MPSKQAHVATAQRNQKTLDFLLTDDAHLPWAVAVAFYKALHVIEAMLDCNLGDGCQRHTDEHKSRHRLLKTTRRFEQLWKMYRPLFEASMVARYLRLDGTGDEYDLFEQYLPREAVVQLLIGHYLHQIEASATRLSGDPDLLK